MSRFLQISLLFVFLLPSFSKAQNDSLLKKKDEPHLGFFDLNVGFDLKNASGAKPAEYVTGYARDGWGLSVRMQNSFVANYIYNPAKKYKIKVGEIMSAELGSGYVSGAGYNYYNYSLLLEYRFEFGVMAIMRLNDKNELGLTITAIQFARDRISPNISGSNILIRYRFSRLVAQAGLEGRRDRMFGWINSFKPNYYMPMQYIGELRYLISSSKNIGVRAEILSDKNSAYTADDVRFQNIISIRVFYGIYF